MLHNLIVGWLLMIFGVLIGMTIGLWAHDDEWAHGYPSYRRRMLRLSHIAAFALGIINVLYAFVDAAFVAVFSSKLSEKGE